MNRLLLDTHIWIWHLTGSDRLPAGLRKALDGGRSECWLSPMSVWEFCMLAERGRIRIKGDSRTWVKQALDEFPVTEAPVNQEVALVSREVDLSHRDPVDELIAATALVYELTLVTVDERLRRAKWLPTKSR